jgi:1,4-dihydroxy-2-naphthoate octaprenyltransferase
MDIIEAMQAAVTPVFLLTGVGALVNVMMGRLTRIKDRMRIMQAIGVEANDIDDQKIIDHAKQKLIKRSSLVYLSITLAAANLVIVCFVIISLFVGAITSINFDFLIASLFILCMLLLLISLISMVLEVYIARSSMHSKLKGSESVIAKIKLNLD